MFSRFWFGKWIFDEQSGEWHRVAGRDERGPLIDPTPQAQRRGIAFDKRQDRKAELIVALVVLIPSAWYCLKVYAHPRVAILPFQHHDTALVATWALFLLLGIMVIWMLGILLKIGIIELVYKSGKQGWEGAQVIDPPPRAPPGWEVVEQQKGYGDARNAPMVDIDRAYANTSRSEPQTQFRE